MVWYHVPQCAGFFVKTTAALDAESLGGGDLNVVDMVAVPQRLEDAVGEAQHQNVLNRFFAEEVIDAIDLILGQDLEDLCVECCGGGEVMAERFFDDDTSPCVLRLPHEPGGAELLDDGTEEPVGYGQIEQRVGRASLAAELLAQQFLEPAVGFSLREVPLHIMHATGEP